MSAQVAPEVKKGPRNQASNGERASKGGFRSEDEYRPPPKASEPDGIPGEDGQKDASQFVAQTEVELPIIDKLPFNLWVAATTFLNILIMGLEQDLDPGKSGMLDRLPWYLLECIFVCCFIVELIIRYVAMKRLPETFFQDGWNIADVILVALAAFDAVFLVPTGVGGQIRYFTCLRALRIIRLVRLVRMYSAFRELWLLCGGLMNSVKALSWVAMVVLLIMYVCGIIVTAEIGKNDEVYGIGPSYNGEVWPYQQYFGTIFKSMFTLFQVLTLDGWCDDVVRHVIYRQPIMGVFLVGFVLMTSFGLMNVVVGIIVENTLAAAQVVDKRNEEKQSKQRKDTVEQLVAILERSDSKRSGLISIEELRAANQSVVVQQKFALIGLAFEEVEHIFTLLDVDRSGKIELQRFENACRELVGGGKRRDIAQVEVNMGTLANRLDKLDFRFTSIEKEVSAIAAMTEDFVHNTVRHLTGHDPTTFNKSKETTVSSESY